MHIILLAPFNLAMDKDIGNRHTYGNADDDGDGIDAASQADEKFLGRDKVKVQQGKEQAVEQYPRESWGWPREW
jgi:hypothetical protein